MSYRPRPAGGGFFTRGPCLAIRASDTRITDAAVILIPFAPPTRARCATKSSSTPPLLKIPLQLP